MRNVLPTTLYEVLYTFSWNLHRIIKSFMQYAIFHFVNSFFLISIITVNNSSFNTTELPNHIEQNKIKLACIILKFQSWAGISLFFLFQRTTFMKAKSMWIINTAQIPHAKINK